MKNKKNLIKVALVLIAALIISTLALTSCSFPTTGGMIDPNNPVCFGLNKYTEVCVSDGPVATCDFEVFQYSHTSYDYVEFSFSPTVNVDILSETRIIVPYDESKYPVVEIEFTATPTFEGVSLDFSTTLFEAIYIDAVAYRDGEAVYVNSFVMSILPTPNGVYASLASGNAFNLYALHLYEKDLITNLEYRRIRRTHKGSTNYNDRKDLPDANENIEIPNTDSNVSP